MTWRRVVALAALIPTALSAQPRGGDGFLFRPPQATLSVRVGAGQTHPSGDLFEGLTARPKDFLGAAFMADLSVPLSQRFELQFTGGTSAREVKSEYRDFIDNDDRPIEQSSSFRRIPLSLGLKWNLVEPGRQISRLAWVPTRFVPYLAAGGGAMHYRFQQSGDFIDFEDNTVFGSTLKSSGWGTLGYGAAGATFNLSRSMGLQTEVRYDLANAPLRGNFEGFDKISLSGVGLTAGFLFRF